MVNDFEDRRVKFYSKNDLSIASYFKRIEEIMASDYFSESKNVNDIIELFNVCKFFDNEISSSNWTIKTKEDYISKISIVKGIIGKFCTTINDSNIEMIFGEIDSMFTEDFWEMFGQYGVYRNVSESKYVLLQKSDKYRISEILAIKKIVNYYGSSIKKYLSAHIQSVELLIMYFFEENGDVKKLFLPKEVTEEDKTNLLRSYISWDEANINYLKLLAETPVNSECGLSERDRFFAKTRYDELVQKIFVNGRGFTYGSEAVFESCDDPVELEYDKGRLIGHYSLNWINENLDYSTLLNNFIYLFSFTDIHFRSTHTSRQSQLGIFEREIGVKGKKEYTTGVVFEQGQMMRLAQMQGYRAQLELRKIYIEDVIEWFFDSYLVEEFSAKGFRFNKPTVESSYWEKFKSVVGELDSIFKQYKLWCEDGYINWEFFDFSSIPVMLPLSQSDLGLG